MNKKKNILISGLVTAFVLLNVVACKDQLDVGNPNAPTVQGNVTDRSGLISYAQGVVYVNGFINGDGWLGNSYFSLPYGYQELLGDVVGAQAANQLISTLSIPDYFILDNGTKITNTSTSIGLLRANNTRAQTGSGYNPTYYQWMNMYAMNNGCNRVLGLIETLDDVSADANVANTFKAWAYWWKGYAYASIGSMYYAGLIVDEDSETGTSSDYVTHDAIIARSDFYFNQAATTIDAISDNDTYNEILGQLIPEFTQVGNGGIPSKIEWKRNINTMLARNILLNHLSPFINGNMGATITKSTAPAMTTADWDKIIQLAGNGIQEGDVVFTGRTISANGFFTAAGGSVAAMTTGPNSSTTFRLSERFVQNFKAGDARMNNFNTNTQYKDDLTFGTRYSIEDGLVGGGVHDYGSKVVGEYELYIAGSYEENALMLAEANIRKGNIDAGLDFVDDVRDYMGAGVAAVSGTGLTANQAFQELFMERRAALAFRGLSFYDYRRWGITYDIANGGGSYGNTLYYSTGAVNTNVTINYNFLDYWDVPADESDLNPSTSDVTTKNPNF